MQLRYIMRMIEIMNPQDIARPLETQMQVLQYLDEAGEWQDVLVEESFVEYEKFSADGELVQRKTMAKNKSS